MDSKEVFLDMLKEHVANALILLTNLHTGDPRADGLLNSACYFLNHASECIKDADEAYKEVD